MISSILLTVIGLGLVALTVSAALSPIETLSWWAGWTEDEIMDEEPAAPAPDTGQTPGQSYIVYLSGIASISGRYLLPREKAFINHLKTWLPEATVVADVFPYSPQGTPLLGATRIFDRLWRRLQQFRIEGRQTMLTPLINMRNIYQVMISADHRYGPIFNQGVAKTIEDALLRAGYRPGCGAPVTIIGYSGGGQIAVGAAPFLTSRLRASVDILTLGGVIASDPGLHFVRRLHHLIGGKDNIQKIGAIMFPERWTIFNHSDWNAAKRDGRIQVYRLEDVAHAGPHGYFGLVKFDGESNNQKTSEMVAAILSPSAPATDQ